MWRDTGGACPASRTHLLLVQSHPTGCAGCSGALRLGWERDKETAVNDRERHHPTAKKPPRNACSGRASGMSTCSINPARDRGTCPLLHGDIHPQRLAMPTGAVPGVTSHGFPPCFYLLVLGCPTSPDTVGNPTPKAAGEVRHLQPIPASLRCPLFTIPAGKEGIFRGTHWYYSLQADVEVLLLVGFEFFQGNSGFSDKLIVAEFVLVTHGDPAGERGKGEHQPGWSSA